MAKRDPPRPGSKTAAEIFSAVGAALSYWEASEDTLLGIFQVLQGGKDKPASKDYVPLSRMKRSRKLHSAIEANKALFEVNEGHALSLAIQELDKLTPTRNEIAHGFCTEYGNNSNAKVATSGYYWVPAWNEGAWIERDFRFAHTAATIQEFTASVRKHRSTTIDIWFALLKRHPDRFTP